MMNRGGRQFSRGNGSGMGAPYRNRRFRGQYTRTRSPPDLDEPGHVHDQNHRPQGRNDIEEMREICSKLSADLDFVKARIADIAGTLERMQVQMNAGKKPKAPAAGPAAGPARKQDAPEGTNHKLNGPRKRKDKLLPNDDSTTQAADPSSEDKLDGEEDGDRVKKVYRRKRNQFNRRGYRRRMDSSERNSNDTSPQNGEDYRRPKPRQRKIYPELSEAEMNEVVQALKRDFFAPELPAVTKTLAEKGPKVAKEFAYAILDHAIQDVTSPTKLSEIATSLGQIVSSDEASIEFQSGLCRALNDLSKRGEEIVIDAPRYMDTLGQVLGQIVTTLHGGRGKKLIRRFLTKSLHSFLPLGRASLLASVMRGIADSNDERFAKSIWDMSGLKWTNILKDGSNLDEFLAEERVLFTTRSFTPEPQKTRRTSQSMDKFADDVTDLVEKGCTPQALEDKVRELGLEEDEKTDCLGTLVYAIVRGCLVTDFGESRLDNDTLNKYSSLIKSVQTDSIVLLALVELTKLWHELKCPRDLMSNMLLALHNQGVASSETLQTWLNSEDLKNTPGIGAARLNSKRCIEDLCAMRNQ